MWEEEFKVFVSYNFGWVRDEDNPIVPTIPNSWKSVHTANPDLLLMGDTYFLYYRGQDSEHDRIGVMTISKAKFDGKTWREYPRNPIIDVGPPGSFDSKHILDPSAVYVNGNIYLYYTAWSDSNSTSVGLATSEDGYRFTKYPGNPIIQGGGPEVVYKDGIFYLFYTRPNKVGGFSVHVATSKDGYKFSECRCNPVLQPGEVRSWDSKTIVTPRIFEEDGEYYMIYGSSDKYADYPSHFGLAISSDLYSWTKYPRNPVFERGKVGSWDEGAIWFGTIYKCENTYYMWYESYGGGLARIEEYGSGGSSQIGLAILKREGGFLKI